MKSIFFHSFSTSYLGPKMKHPISWVTQPIFLIERKLGINMLQSYTILRLLSKFRVSKPRNDIDIVTTLEPDP